LTAESLINDCLSRLVEQGVLSLDSQQIEGLSSHPNNRIIQLKGVSFCYKTFREVGPQQVSRITAKRYEQTPLLVMAAYITPKAKAALRQANVNYIECSGNAFIQTNIIYIYIDTNQQIPQVKLDKARRGISKAGVKVIYQFLCDPSLLNQTHRTIAYKAQTALGSIPNVMKSLKEEGFVLKGRNGWMLDDYPTLLAKWVQAFYEKLQPGLLIGRFKPLKPETFYAEWQQLDLVPETEWGGEPAGTLLRAYLKPAVFTVYTTASAPMMMKHYNWQPDDKGPITVYQSFWKDLSDYHPVVHPVLAYADLINSGDQRCWETAQKIHERYVREIADRAAK
jgi:hypothetical protein